MTSEFIITPRILFRDKNLSRTDIDVLSLIISLALNKGYCYASNDYLKEYINSSERTINYSLSKLSNPPLCRVEFGVKDEKECKKKVLAKAYEDAKTQAEAIATAAGKELKSCAKVDFKPFTTEYLSNASFDEKMAYAERVGTGSAQTIVNIFTPEDIEISETLYCLWVAE